MCGARDRRAGDEPVSGPRHADEQRSCVRRNRVVLAPEAGVKSRRSCEPDRAEKTVNPLATVTITLDHRGERV